MNKQIVYEFPLNERMRIFMRLEKLFLQLDYFMDGNTVFDSRIAISVLLNILIIFNRNDLKSELLQELRYNTEVLSRISNNQNVDTEKLDKIFVGLNDISKKLYEDNGKIDVNTMRSDLLHSISQRSSILCGTYEFDLPAFHYWLEQDNKVKRDNIVNWTKHLVDIRAGVDLILSFVRQSSSSTQETAKAGFFQFVLDRPKPYKLVRVELGSTLPYFVENSGGKHRFTLHFMNPSQGKERPSKTSADIPFLLTLGVF